MRQWRIPCLEDGNSQAGWLQNADKPVHNMVHLSKNRNKTGYRAL